MAVTSPDKDLFAVVSVTVEHWYEQSNDYNYRTGKPKSPTALISAFTALIWKGTTKLGIGISTAKDGKVYIVFHFAPVGNTDGDFKTNVLSPNGNIVRLLL